MTNNELRDALAKVPAVTLGFWIIKILATTLGETGGDTVTMTWLGETTPLPTPYGYLIGTIIFGVLLAGFVIAQIIALAVIWPYELCRADTLSLANFRSTTPEKA